LASDPPFKFLVEAFEGRSRSAFEGGQKSSTWKNRQEFLDLVNRKVPASDIASLLQMISAAIFFYDKIPEVEVENFLFLTALLQFLKDYCLISKGRFKVVSQEIQARVKFKKEEFDSFLLQWHRETEGEAFERALVHAVEEAETMQQNRREAKRRRTEVRERSWEVREAVERTTRIQEARAEERSVPPRAKLDPELRNRSPLRSDLRRLVPEERALVHAIKEEANRGRPINWLALSTETFYNELPLRDCMDLADLQEKIEAEEELKEDYVTPPGSPMKTE
jgi:hypothetical protein